MSTMLPWLALAAAVAAFFARESAPPPDPSSGAPTRLWRTLASQRPAWIGALLFALVAIVAAWRAGESAPGAMAAAVGAAIGCALACASHAASAVREEEGALSVVPLAFAVAAVGLLEFGTAEGAASAQVGLVAGATAGAWILGSGTWALLSAATAASIVAANLMGRAAGGGHLVQSGTVLGLAGSVGAVIALGAAMVVKRQKGTERASSTGAVIAATIVFAAGAVFVSRRHLFLEDLGNLSVLGAAAALIVHWLLPARRDDPSGIRFTLATIVWVALATIAFGIERGLGMAVAALGAVVVLAAAGNARALLSIGPALALVFYRVFRETHPSSSRAFDIGQHYAIIGILVGVLIPAALAAWQPPRASSSGRVTAAAWLGVLLAGGLPVACAVFLGAKGIVGLIVGLGLASFAEGMRGTARLSVLVLASHSMAVLVLAYGWLAGSLDLAREEKIPLLIWIALIAFALSLLVGWLGNAPKEEPA